MKTGHLKELGWSLNRWPLNRGYTAIRATCLLNLNLRLFDNLCSPSTLFAFSVDTTERWARSSYEGVFLVKYMIHVLSADSDYL